MHFFLLNIVETSNMEWIIYALCIAAVVIVTGLSHLFRSYRKRKSSKESKVNGDAVLEQSTEYPYTGSYDEIDEDMLLDDHTFGVPQTTVTASTEDTGYLDPYFATEDDERNQLNDQTSHNENNSNCSSNSNLAIQNDTEYLNPYHTLQDNWKEVSHGYEVAVTVHTGFKSSCGSDEEATGHKYSHKYQDRYKKGHSYEIPHISESNARNDVNVLIITPARHGTCSLQDNVNDTAESDKTIEIKTCNNPPPDQTEWKATENVIFRDFNEFAEHSLPESFLNTNVCSQENTNINLNAYDDAKSVNI